MCAVTRTAARRRVISSFGRVYEIGFFSPCRDRVYGVERHERHARAKPTVLGGRCKNRRDARHCPPLYVRYSQRGGKLRIIEVARVRSNKDGDPEGKGTSFFFKRANCSRYYVYRAVGSRSDVSDTLRITLRVFPILPGDFRISGYDHFVKRIRSNFPRGANNVSRTPPLRKKEIDNILSFVSLL